MSNRSLKIKEIELTMKLYFAPGACSLAVHIALEEAGLPFTVVQVDRHTKVTGDGENYLEKAPNGYVPLLELGNGVMLSECAVILQYVADQSPQRKLIPACGDFARYRVQEWLNFVVVELHKRASLLINPAASMEMKAQAQAQLSVRLAWVNSQLAERDVLVGTQFSVADIYLGWFLNAMSSINLDLSDWGALTDYRKGFLVRPAVRAAMQREGLLPTA